MVFFFLSATLPSHTRWCFEYAGAALRQVRGGNWRWFTPITGGVNSISAGFTPDTWSIFKLWRFFISAKYTRYMVVFVIRRNSMGGVFHHLLGALPLFFWTFFVWKKKMPSHMWWFLWELTWRQPSFPYFGEEGRRKEEGLAVVAAVFPLWFGGEVAGKWITHRLRAESSPLSFRFYSKEVERWGDRRFLRIPISL